MFNNHVNPVNSDSDVFYIEKTMKSALIVLMAFAICAQAQILTDSRDGKKYKTVKIGEQTWMAENLDYHGEDGLIGFCHGRKTENCKKYGRLYDWVTAIKVCPRGWHLPSDEEWQTLVDFAGGDAIAGTKLKATSGWNTGRDYIAGTDNYGFSALPGGFGFSDANFGNFGGSGLWWSRTEFSNNDAYYRYMYYYESEVSRKYYYKSRLFSVRCVQD